MSAYRRTTSGKNTATLKELASQATRATDPYVDLDKYPWVVVFDTGATVIQKYFRAQSRFVSFCLRCQQLGIPYATGKRS